MLVSYLWALAALPAVLGAPTNPSSHKEEGDCTMMPSADPSSGSHLILPSSALAHGSKPSGAHTKRDHDAGNHHHAAPPEPSSTLSSSSSSSTHHSSTLIPDTTSTILANNRVVHVVTTTSSTKTSSTKTSSTKTSSTKTSSTSSTKTSATSSTKTSSTKTSSTSSTKTSSTSSTKTSSTSSTKTSSTSSTKTSSTSSTKTSSTSSTKTSSTKTSSTSSTKTSSTKTSSTKTSSTKTSSTKTTSTATTSTATTSTATTSSATTSTASTSAASSSALSATTSSTSSINPTDAAASISIVASTTSATSSAGATDAASSSGAATTSSDVAATTSTVAGVDASDAVSASSAAATSSAISSVILSASTVTSSSSTATANATASATSAAATCVNSASDRSCWGNYNTSTNYYDVVPDTGVTREYWFNVENVTAAPDGVERVVLAINGSVPGPTIIADWGDEIIVHVTNSMTNNGSTIHWHGIRQNYTNQMDGVPSITQCPIAPGDTQTYKWRAVQYGTSWYHSHFSVQAWDGVFGGILINGPATANYDVDLGHVFLNDWSHQTADVLALAAATTGPPTSDNGLINGTNTWTNTDGTVVGSRFETNFVAGTRYRIRLVNGAADTHFRFTIDNHTLEVIANDFVPIVPYTTTDVSIGMGQRYDVIVTATETTGNFWLRGIPQESCSDNNNVNNILGIVRYDSASTADPTSTAYSTLVDSCSDESASNLAPFLAIDVGAVAATDDEEATLAFGTSILWTMNAVSFVSEWNYPTVEAVADGNTSWSTAEHVWSLPTADEWVMMVIQTDFAQAHPIHLHGHDFWVLGSGAGVYANTTTLQTVGAPRRDVAMLPASGWLALAWKTDNPGAWIMHCHIAWHADEGFALQMVERESEINALQNNTYIDNTCANWNAYVAADGIVQDDSGI